jgi:hypothetical protein
VRGSARHQARAGIALAGLMLAVAGCSHVLPLGPAPAPTPTPRHLAAAIVMEPGLIQSDTAANGCPAGSVVLSGPGTLISSPAGDSSISSPVGSISSPVGDSSSTPSSVCYRRLAKPVTFTSAGVTLYQQPAGNKPVQHPAVWMLRINLPAAEVAALTAITKNAVHSRTQIAIVVAGQTWGVPFTNQPLTNGQFAISTQSRSQALRLQRILLPPA